MKKIRCWNGIVMGNGGKQVYSYVGAFSRADVIRVLDENGYRNMSDGYIRDYWSECWGRKMDGISPERGLWLEVESGTVERIRTKTTGGSANGS